MQDKHIHDDTSNYESMETDHANSGLAEGKEKN